MIQRVQTLFLGGVVILSALLLFLPIQEITSGENKYLLCLMPGCLKGMTRPFIYVPMIFNVIILLLSLICIFLYKNRKLQMRLAFLVFILSVFLSSNIFTFKFTTLFPADATVSVQVAAFFPIINAVLAALARRYIKKDEELVRSADRIR